MEIVSEESSLQHQRPETSHGNAHPVDNDPEIHLPMVMVQEFQRLASTVHIDYYDFQELLGLTSQGSQDIPTSSFAYFISEVIRKIERFQSQPTGGGGGGDYEYDETEIHRKKKKDQIKKQEKKLLSKVTALDEEIQYNITMMNQQNHHQIDNKPTTKNTQINQQKLMKNYYKEKQQKQILEEFIESQNKKMKILILHIEKLVKALKIENNKKIKISEEYHLLRKEELQLKEKIDKQNQIHSVQNRAIEELKAGSKVLEDQLKLMDEKFLELRSKLDVSRNHFIEKMKKIQKECTDLRTKYSIATGGSLLDHVRLDKRKSGTTNEHLTVTIQSEPALFTNQTVTPFNNNSDRRGSSPHTFGKNSPTEEIRKGNVQFEGASDRRGSATSPTNAKLDPARKSSSFQEIKNLPKPRPVSAVELDHTLLDGENGRRSLENRPKSAMMSGLPSHPSLTTLSRTSKDKAASLIVRRIRTRASGGKENWTAERIFELLDG